MTKQDAANYLSGMIDGEGHVGYSQGVRKTRIKYPDHRFKGTAAYKNRQLVIYNCDLDLIDACIECLCMLNVPYRYYTYERKEPGWNDQHEIRITHRQGFEILNQVLNLRSKKKREALQVIVESYEKLAV